jgi:hypothetical protein
MKDEAPLDLDLLDPDDPPDLVRPAVRRFRVRVVLFTVGCVLLAAALAGWGVKAYVDHEHRFTIEDAMSPAQLALVMDPEGNCRTPTYRVGPLEVTLLDTAPMSGGRLAMHFVVHGEQLAEQRDQPNGSSFRSFTLIRSEADTSGVGQVSVAPRATWGEAFVTASEPASLMLPMVVTGPSLPNPGRFSVDLSSLACNG